MQYNICIRHTYLPILGHAWWCLRCRDVLHRFAIHPLCLLAWANLARCLIVAILRYPSEPLASTSRALFLSHPSIRRVITSEWSLLLAFSPVHPNVHLARTTCFNNLSVVLGPSIHPTGDRTLVVLTLVPSWLADLQVEVVERVRRRGEGVTSTNHAQTSMRTRQWREHAMRQWDATTSNESLRMNDWEYVPCLCLTMFVIDKKWSGYWLTLLAATSEESEQLCETVRLTVNSIWTTSRANFDTGVV